MSSVYFYFVCSYFYVRIINKGNNNEKYNWCGDW